MSSPIRCRHCGAVRESAASSDGITSPKLARQQFAQIANSDQEQFAVLSLTTHNTPLGVHVVAIGGLNICAIQPRDVFRPAIQDNAAAVIIAHNHPSGDPTASPEDLAVTRHLQESGRQLGIEVLDHLVIARDRFSSLREQGAL